MANHAGKEGIVKVGASPVAVAEVREWEINTTGENQDNSSMNSVQSNGGWRTHNPTLQSWEGKLTCWWDETDTNGQETLDVNTAVALKVYPEGADTGDAYFSGSATVTVINRKAAMDGNVEVEFSFKGNGALTQAVAS